MSTVIGRIKWVNLQKHYRRAKKNSDSFGSREKFTDYDRYLAPLLSGVLFRLRAKYFMDDLRLFFFRDWEFFRTHSKGVKYFLSVKRESLDSNFVRGAWAPSLRMTLKREESKVVFGHKKKSDFFSEKNQRFNEDLCWYWSRTERRLWNTVFFLNCEFLSNNLTRMCNWSREKLFMTSICLILLFDFLQGLWFCF